MDMNRVIDCCSEVGQTVGKIDAARVAISSIDLCDDRELANSVWAAESLLTQAMKRLADAAGRVGKLFEAATPED